MLAQLFRYFTWSVFLIYSFLVQPFGSSFAGWFFSTPTPTFASELEDPQSGSANSIIPLETVIQGKIHFKPRFTRVHESREISGVGSPNSQIYWSIEVTSGPTRYILNRRINVGNPVAPEAVDLAGVLLRAGSFVEIEGKVVTGMPNYHLILDVNRVTLLSE